jgi:hypothetical protein
MTTDDASAGTSAGPSDRSTHDMWCLGLITRPLLPNLRRTRILINRLGFEHMDKPQGLPRGGFRGQSPFGRPEAARRYAKWEAEIVG